MSFFKRFTRGSTSNTRRPTNSAPTPRTEERPARDNVKPKVKDETEQAEIDRIDTALVKPETPARDKQVKVPPKATEGQEEADFRTQTRANINAENIYHLVWREEESYNMIPTRNPRVNHYTPNAIGLFRLLEAAEDRINYSKHIQVHEPNYIPYAVKVYYAIMFYMQLLEARKTAGDASGFEVSLLKRFHAKYSRESLPCAEIVYAYFNTIVSTELADIKYDWIVPQVADGMFQADFGATDTTTGSIYLQPQVPHMIAILNSFIYQTNVQANYRGDTYTPNTAQHPAVPNNHTAFGFDYDTQAIGNAQNQMNKAIFAACGVSTPVKFGNGNYPQAQQFARDTDFAYQIRVLANPNNTDLPQANHANARQRDFSDIDNFLQMPKTSNLKWFEFIRQQAVIHARFFDTVYHFSDVQSVGGLETAVLCQFKIEDQLRAAPHAEKTLFYASTNLGLTGQHLVPSWNPRPFRDITASFATNRSGLKRNEELQALTYGTNATLPIWPDASAAPLQTLELANGKLWLNKEWIRELFWKNTLPGKDMFSGLNSVVLRCYREKPHGTGVVDNQYD